MACPSRSLIAFLTAFATLAMLAASPVRAEPGPRAADELSAAFKQAARRVAPAVVSIRTKQVVQLRTPDDRLPGSPLEELLERFHGGQPREGRRGRGMVRRGAGSGFVVDGEGHVLTNHHVVAGADEIELAFSDGKELKATLVAADEATDLAVLKVERSSLPAVTLGDSAHLEVGDWVIAVGNPFGLEQTVTAGIVSATGRGTLGLAAYGDFLQTDAAINPGNSGGPLLDLSGRVVGVNTAITTRTGAWNGIGFAIPIQLAREIMTSLIEDGRVARGYLGLLPQDLDEGLARSSGHDTTEGALVAEVVEGQPAEKAGIRAEDIITAIDGRPVHDSQDLRNSVARARPGSEVQVTVLRAGRGGELAERRFTVRLAERPGTGEEGLSSTGSATSPGHLFGFEGRSLGPESADQLGLEGKAGVLVTDVEPGGPADDAGLQVRDLIVRANGEAVESPRDVQRVLRSQEAGEGLRLKVLRAGSARYLFLQPSE
jgi:serine protease Do